MKKSKLRIAFIIAVIITILIPFFDINHSKASGETNVEEDGYWGISATGIDNYIDYLQEISCDTEVKVAILDTGINMNHEIFDGRLDFSLDIKENEEYYYDWVDNDMIPEDISGHGTAVAGIIASSTPSNVKIVPIKIANNIEEVDPSYGGLLYNILQKLSYQVDVICCGFGFSTALVTNRNMYLAVDNYLSEKIVDTQRTGTGIIFVAAAGDSGDDVYFPGTSPYILAASAIGKNKQIMETSSRGPEIDFTAPGEAMTVPLVSGRNTYGTYDGTTVSIGYLASAIALIKAEHPEYSRNEVIDLLKENAEDLGDEGKDDLYGYGSINFNSNMFQYTKINLVNKTKAKACVSLADQQNVTTDFETMIFSRSADKTTECFTVNCSKACFAIVSYDNGESYSYLSATDTGIKNTYAFSIDLENNVDIVIAYKGDVDLDGSIKIADAQAVFRVIKKGTKSLSELSKMFYNVDGDAKIKIADAILILKAIKKPSVVAW